MSNATEYDCPVISADNERVLEQVVYWVEGVCLSVVASFGVVGNLLSCVVLSRRELRSAFNMLLIALALFDTCYITGALLETVRKSFRAATTAHIWLFPLVLYPGQMIALTGSVFLIVAIAFERYVSVHYPLDYNQAMNDPAAIRTRLCKYLVPVVLLSVVLNIPKFLETETVRVITNSTTQEYELHLNYTAMRIDPGYSSFVNWSQLFLLSVIPVCLLVYFNVKIYRDVRDRERRRRPPPPANRNGCTSDLSGPSRVSTLFFRRRVEMSSPSSPFESSRVTTTRSVFDPSTLSNVRRRRVEDRLAVLFMGIVAVYLVCHFPRVLLNFYEMLVIERAMACNGLGHPAFDMWAQLVASASHLLLVVNCSTNFLIYSLFSTQFRETARQLATCAIRRVLPRVGGGDEAAARRRVRDNTETEAHCNTTVVMLKHCDAVFQHGADTLSNTSKKQEQHL